MSNSKIRSLIAYKNEKRLEVITTRARIKGQLFILLKNLETYEVLTDEKAEKNEQKALKKTIHEVRQLYAQI